MPFDLANMDWVTLAIGLGILVVAWVILKTVLKLTMRIFAIGCAGLLILAACGVAVTMFQR
jgi:hypothetical protein